MSNDVLTREEETLKIHTDSSGAVWFLDGQSSPRRTNYARSRFAVPAELRGRDVRILGIHANAALITALYQASKRGFIRRVQLAGRQVCDNQAELQDPVKALFRMRQCQLPGSLGGWHTMLPAELPTYELIEQMLATKRVTDASRAIFQRHPVCRYLRFIPTIKMDQALRVVASMIDPRFFVDPAHPERCSRLYRYLGLTPGIQRDVLNGEAPSNRHRRCKIVTDCWYSSQRAVLLSDPRNFLYRVVQHHLTYTSPSPTFPPRVRGVLRANQWFVAYMRDLWTALLTPFSAAGGEPLFDAGVFFRRSSEVVAFSRHIRSLGR